MVDDRPLAAEAEAAPAGGEFSAAVHEIAYRRTVLAMKSATARGLSLRPA
jgi:hypothetical protein